MGFAANKPGAYEQAKHFFQHAIQIAQELGDPRQLGQLLNVLGGTHLELGEYDEARQAAQAALAARQSVNDRRGVAFSLWLLGELAWRQGNYEEARKHSLQSLKIFDELGLRWGADYALNNLGNIAYAEGNLRQARHYFLATLAPRLAAGTLNHDRVPVALTGIALVLMAEHKWLSTAQLLCHVICHPNAWLDMKNRATKLLATTTAELPQVVSGVAQTRTQTQSLVTVVITLLDEPDVQ